MKRDLTHTLISKDDLEILLHPLQNGGRVHRYPLNTKKLEYLSEKLTDKYLETENTNKVEDYNDKILEPVGVRKDAIFEEKGIFNQHGVSISTIIKNLLCDDLYYSDKLYLDFDSFCYNFIESKKLERRQIKNCFKRLLKGFKVTIVVSSFRNLISRIISPNLFYNYVNDEDDNRVAINNFSFSFLSI